MEQKRIGPATRGDTFASRRRFPAIFPNKPVIEPAKKAPSPTPAEATQPEG